MCVCRLACVCMCVCVCVCVCVAEGLSDFSNFYQGLWDCKGDQSDELSFNRGDLIYILSKVSIQQQPNSLWDEVLNTLNDEVLNAFQA